MQDLIELTPQLLLEQSQEMSSLCSAYESLFANVSSDLNGINDSWSDLLSNNFSVKIGSAQKLFSGEMTMLRNSAEIIRTVAESSQELDAAWASRIMGALDTAMTDGVSEHIPDNDIFVKDKVDIGNYCETLQSCGNDAEYAKLCQLWQEVDETSGKLGDRVMAETFAALLRENLPENDPLRNLSVNQMRVTTSASGLSAVTIMDGDNALVVFGATDVSKLNDLATDANIVFGQASVQSAQAHELINNLSKECSNIVVTGHSLGGYLATATALDNCAVSECIAFDPPGRWDDWAQTVLNSGNVSKVRTYEVLGSFVSAVGAGVGDVRPVQIKGDPLYHSIAKICDALGGKEKIVETWTQSGN